MAGFSLSAWSLEAFERCTLVCGGGKIYTAVDPWLINAKTRKPASLRGWVATGSPPPTDQDMNGVVEEFVDVESARRSVYLKKHSAVFVEKTD